LPSVTDGVQKLSQSVRAVERALDILLCFTPDSPKRTLTQIAEQAGMHKSTVLRLLTSLENKHFIGRDKATGMYQLGFRFIELASIMLRNLDIQQWAQPYLQRLSTDSGETVDLAVLDGHQVVYLKVVESSQRVKIAAAVGERLPVFCTATGKAFLAYLPDDQVCAILDKDLTLYTENTLACVDDLYADLRATRERGFAISEQEYEKDINAVAAPILDVDGCPIAVIAIVGPSYRLTPERMLDLGISIRATTKAIASEIGLAPLLAILPKTATPCKTGQNGLKGEYQ
jgi:DNA-binding IclR family transcriptional regulator